MTQQRNQSIKVHEVECSKIAHAVKSVQTIYIKLLELRVQASVANCASFNLHSTDHKLAEYDSIIDKHHVCTLIDAK